METAKLREHRRLWRGLLLTCMPFAWLRPGLAAQCLPMLEDYPPVFEMVFDLPRNRGTERRLLLPAGAEVFVIAREHGVDVRVEIVSGKRTEASTDDPVRRGGIQHAVVTTHRDRAYVLRIHRKESSSPEGKVHVRAVAFTSSSPPRCLDSQKQLAQADGLFATGQLAGDQDASAVAYRRSADHYMAAAAAFTGHTAIRARANHARASVLYEWVEDWQAACTAATEALEDYEAIGEEYGAMRARLLVAATMMDMSASQETSCGVGLASGSRGAVIRQTFRSAADFHGGRQEYFEQAQALNFLGLSLWSEDGFRESIPLQQQALLLYERMGERRYQAQVLQNIAWANYQLGRVSAALVLYSRALGFVQPGEDPTLYAAILNNSGLASTFHGDHDLALQKLGEALTINASTGNRWWRVVILDNLGLVYDRLGEKALALDFYRQSLALGDAALNSASRRNTLSKMANILAGQGNRKGAIGLRREALSLTVSPSARAIVFTQLAADLRAEGDSAAADDVLVSVLQKPKLLTDFARAVAVMERANLKAAQGAFVEAERDYHEARRVFERLDVPERQLTALVGAARVIERRDPAAALLQLRRAVHIAEDLRLQTANPELRATILEASRPAFDLMIAMLARRYAAERNAGRKRQLAMDALRTAEQARSRALVDFSRLDLRAVDGSTELLERRMLAYEELSDRRQRLESLLAAVPSTSPLVTAVRDDISALRQRLNDIDARLAAKATPSASDSRRSFHLQDLPEDFAVVEYWAGAERVFAWVATRQDIAFEDVGETDKMNDAAVRLRDGLRRIGSGEIENRLRPGDELYAALFAPIRAHVDSRKTIAVIADGALHYIPFGVLRSPQGRFLIEDHDLVISPSIYAAVSRGQMSPSTKGKVLLVSDPVYERTDSRFAEDESREARAKGARAKSVHGAVPSSRTAPVLRRLRGTAVEAAAIRSLFSSYDVTELNGFNAQRDRFLNSGLDGYRYIHIASHAISDPEIPQLSAIILSTVDKYGNEIPGRVLAADFMTSRLSADVLVLSGCETTIGRRIEGEGLMGLQYTMLARGANTVVSSLWQVPDRKGAEMISAFYTGMLQRKLTPSRALAETMRNMLATGSDPGIWSAFVLTTMHQQGLT